MTSVRIRIESLRKELGLSRRHGFSYNHKKITVLQDINFQVEHGEFIGVIGANGAGKTTLLRIIAQILKPSAGKVFVDGKTTAFLEMGVGFHDDLSVRENIHLYGALVGLSSKEIRNKFNDILEFSELADFCEFRLRELSQGMRVRLAFSTIVFTDPDIFLVDEALGVGDRRFREKCYSLFQKLKRQKKTFLLVSHDESLIEAFCDKVLLLDRGRQVMFGDTTEALKYYNAHFT